MSLGYFRGIHVTLEDLGGVKYSSGDFKVVKGSFDGVKEVQGSLGYVKGL